MATMTSYEPDPKTAQIFARYKRAHEAERELKPGMRTAAATAIRDGASNQELAALTDLTPEFFRKLAIEIGVDNRRKAPTVGREADAKRANASVRTEATEQSQAGLKPRLPAELGLEPQIRQLTPAQVKGMVEQVKRDHPDWAAKSHRTFARTLPTYLPYVLANDAFINEKAELPAAE